MTDNVNPVSIMPISDEKCSNCGSDASDGNLLFVCEWCGRKTCSDCHRMTSDYEQICPQCVKDKGLTEDELEI